MRGDGETVPSPCTRACTLDDSEVCLGCGRTIGEIAAWPEADGAARREIAARAAFRRALRRPFSAPPPRGR